MQSLLRPFPTPLTGKQWFYLLFLQGVGAGVSHVLHFQNRMV